MLNEYTESPLVDSSWHANQPEILGRAVGFALKAEPHLSRLARLILPRMPPHVYATSTLKTDMASCRMMPLDEAIACEHIGIRDSKFARAVAIDIDNDEWPERLAELYRFGLPKPTWIAANPWTGRCHAVWWLFDAVLLGDRGLPAPQRLLALVQALLTEALNGDTAYSRVLTRNPWRCGRPVTKGATPALPSLWEIFKASGTRLQHAVIPAPQLHTLHSLRLSLLAWQTASETPTPRRRRGAPPARSEHGANLFNAVRFRVYAAWPCDITTVGVIAAEEATRLGSPIAARQLTGMVRNIHRWMKRRWKGRRTSTGKYINRGRDSLAVSGLDLAERQAVAGRRTAEARARITDEQLRTAVARLENRGLRVTQAAIAAEAGVSIRTVARWQQPDIRCPSVKDAATACFRINDEATVHCGAPSAHAALILGSGSSGTESLFERGS